MKPFAAVLAALLLAGCDEVPPTAPGDISINIENNNTNTIAGANPSASPSPGVSGPISEVRVVEVGRSCPTGVVAPTEQRTLRVGCRAFVTCTPFVKRGDGTTVPATAAEHGPSPDSFGVPASSGVLSFEPWDSEPFNADITARATGSSTITCVVKGRPGSNAWTVVQ